MYHIKVKHSSQQHVTREAVQSEWDHDDVDNVHQFHGYEIADTDFDKKYADFTVERIPECKELYLVYVLHTQGDSFGTEEHVLCMVNLFDSYRDAQTLALAIKNDYAKYDKDGINDYLPLKVTLPSGKIIDVATSSWKGYFERMQDIQVHCLHNF